MQLSGRLGLWVSLFMTGCASLPAPQPHDGNVFYYVLDAAYQDEERLKLSDDEDFHVGQPIPDTRKIPEYPAAWLGRAPAMLSVCVELTIDERGVVVATQPIKAAEGCEVPPSMASDFHAAVARATEQWQFQPSIICKLVSGAVVDGTCDEATEQEAVPMLRAYRFRFEKTPTGPQVSSGADAND